MPEAPDWRERLRRSGHRLTPQCARALEAVEQLGHATPDEVFAHVQGDGINLSTVYRTLELLNELGLIRHAHLTDRAPTYHALGDREHFHLVCRGCRSVLSVSGEEIAGFAAGVKDNHGFSLDLGHLTVFGLCQDCM